MISLRTAFSTAALKLPPLALLAEYWMTSALLVMSSNPDPLIVSPATWLMPPLGREHRLAGADRYLSVAGDLPECRRAAGLVEFSADEVKPGGIDRARSGEVQACAGGVVNRDGLGDGQSARAADGHYASAAGAGIVTGRHTHWRP